MPESGIALLIPAYRAAAFLPRLLEAARAQTVPFSEIHVYDDASPDDTAALAQRLGATVTRGLENCGCSVGKNILARKTSCPWLHFHDADDSLKPDFVEKALAWTRLPAPPDVVLFDYETRIHESDTFLGVRHFDGEALRSDPLAYVLAEQINPFCGLYRREAFLVAGGWDEDPDVLQAEDQAGHLRLALAGLRFDADPAVTVINHIRQGSMTTANPSGANRAILAVLRKALAAPATVYLRTRIGTRLWQVSGFAAACLDWPTADAAALLAASIHAPLPPETGRLFRALKHLSPRLALRVREYLIRLLRSSLRRAPAFTGKWLC